MMLKLLSVFLITNKFNVELSKIKNVKKVTNDKLQNSWTKDKVKP